MSNIVSFNDMQMMAEAIAKSGLFGMKDTNSVLALMAVAQAEGLHPATAARDFHIIQGRPALKADAMLARFQNAGGKVEWTEYTDERVTGNFTHPNGGSLAVTWTIEQATKIGLVKPGSGWQKFPRAMLRSRCISEGIRSVFPGSVTGFYSPEEVADFDNAPIKDITPPKTVIEAPRDVSIVDMEDDPIEEKIVSEEGFMALMLPDNTVYSKHQEMEEWIDAYANLYVKVRDSKKIASDEKKHKLDSLKTVNQLLLTRLDMNQNIRLAQRLQPVVPK
jgi:RecT family